MENMLHDINRSDVAEEKISKSEDVIIGNFQNKTWKENRKKKTNRILAVCGITSNDLKYMQLES